MEGIGNSHITIKATPEAQAWFDQGLNLLHDFWEYESQKAFEQSIRVDPQCAMCRWGLAQAEGLHHSPSWPYAKTALAEAARLKRHASGSDNLYIEAAQAESAAKDDDHAQATAIYRKLVKKYPRDPQARIFLAESLGDGYDDAGEPKAGQKECISILEGVLRDRPNDSAANHYWIHAIEPGNHPERALKSAELLASLAPASGHMVHMPGHIYYRVGNYPEAERWFTASMNVDEKYMREQHVSPDNDWNYVHNMMYAIANLMEQGRLADANALSDHLAAARGKLSDSLYIWSARDQVSRVSLRLPVALRVGDWNAVLTMVGQATLAGDNTANLRALADELTDYATGMKALETGDLAAARAASDRMDARLWRLEQRQKEETAAKDKGQEGQRGFENRGAAEGAGDAGRFERAAAQKPEHPVFGVAGRNSGRPRQARRRQKDVRRSRQRREKTRLSRAADVHPARRRNGGRGAHEGERLCRRLGGLRCGAEGAAGIGLRPLWHRPGERAFGRCGGGKDWISEFSQSMAGCRCRTTRGCARTQGSGRRKHGGEINRAQGKGSVKLPGIGERRRSHCPPSPSLYMYLIADLKMSVFARPRTLSVLRSYHSMWPSTSSPSSSTITIGVCD